MNAKRQLVDLSHDLTEHLTDLATLPPTGFRFTAVPPKIEGAVTFTVRAFAALG